jgi:hypothetical protein
MAHGDDVMLSWSCDNARCGVSAVITLPCDSLCCDVQQRRLKREEKERKFKAMQEAGSRKLVCRSARRVFA